MHQKSSRGRPASVDQSSVGVVAIEGIPEGLEVLVGGGGAEVEEGLGGLHRLLQFSRTLRDERQVSRLLSVSLSRKSSQPAIIDDCGGLAWTGRLQGARDCSEQNLELLLPSPTCGADAEPTSGYRLRVTREIRPGEQLLVWFADACGLQLGVPFLSVLNIRAHHCYQCHLCQRKFLHPNVLKAHLMHDCLQHQLPQHQLPPLPPPQLMSLPLPRGLFEFAASHHLAPPPDLLEILLRCGLPHPLPTLPMSLLSQFPTRPTQPPPLQHRHRRPWEDDHRHPSSTHQHSSSFDSVSDSTATAASTPLKPPAKSVSVASSQSATVEEAEAPEEAAAPSALELPSDAEPLDLIPRSLYTCKSNRGHLCIYCGKVYSRKYGLKIHLRTHTGYKPLKCRVCLRPFGDPSNLNKHIRLHAEGDTPYRCEFCAKVLVRRRDLERHQRSRHPDKILLLTASVATAK